MIDETDDVRPTLVQAGWAVYSKEGTFVGEVLGADERRFLLQDGQGSERRLEIPTEFITEEEPLEMRARISLAANEIGVGHEDIAAIPRESAHRRASGHD